MLGLVWLPLLIGVQSTAGWSERGTTTASVLFCRQTGQTLGAALFEAVPNGALAARLGGAGDLDSTTRSLDLRTPDERLRHAVTEAVHAVYLSASCAAGLAFLVEGHCDGFRYGRAPPTRDWPPWFTFWPIS